MSLLKKSTKPQSSRSQIQIDGVRDGVLILPKREYRIVLESSSINFELMSDDEQDALIDTYQDFLNSLNTPFQIVVRIRELDMDKYLDGFKARMNNHEEEIYRTQSQNYIEFVSKLVSHNKILTRKFYVVLPYKADDKDFPLIKEQLKLQADIVAKGLGRLGMQVRKLNSLEVLDLFYSFYSPGQAKRAPLRDQTIQLLKESYL
jgi:hypothetical protein